MVAMIEVFLERQLDWECVAFCGALNKKTAMLACSID
jgi:hypothetical protein